MKTHDIPSNYLDRLSDYVDRLTTGRRFSVARYGDGEWGAVLGLIHNTSYGDKVTPELAKAIGDTLKSPRCVSNYFYASLGEPWTNHVNDWILENGVDCNWARKQVLEQASKDGELLPFLKALRGRKVLIVGLNRLTALKHDVLPGAECLALRPNCFTDRKFVTDFVEADDEHDVVLFACGLASVVFIHDLYDKTDATLIDIGSLFDPYVGFESRRGHRTPEFRENVRKTLEALNADKAETKRVPDASQPGSEAVRQSADSRAATAAVESGVAVPRVDEDADSHRTAGLGAAVSVGDDGGRSEDGESAD